MNLLPWLPDRPERTEVVHELTQAAFAPYASLARPSGALAETVDDVAADLAAGGGLLAYDEGWSTALGALRWRVDADHLWVKRVAVHPDHHGSGVGGFLMDACRGIAHATDRARIRLGVRHALEENRRWYGRRGYQRVVDHDDWAEYEAPVAPLDFHGAPVTLWKYEYPDHLQATFDVDVVEETSSGIWVRVPQFTPSFTDGRIVWLWPQEAVGWLPRDEWWTAWFSTGRQHLKVDICTPARRRPDGDLEFADLCLDVVARDDEAPIIVDQEELAAAGYPAELVSTTEAAAAAVLQRVLAGDEPFTTEGPARLRT